MNRHLRWTQLCRALGATNNVDSSYRQLVHLYQTPVRAYHNLLHIEHCLGEYDAVHSTATEPVAVEAAIWFHDAVYDSKAGDNEEKSASMGDEILAGMGVPAKLRATVRKLIIHTKHTAVPRTKDGKIIVDIDLAILGSSPSGFARYERNIREEYRWVPESAFWPKRAGFLQTLLKRKRIFSTDFFFR